MITNSRLSIILLVFAVSLWQGCRERSNEEVEQIIAKSEKLRYIDGICKEFPKPGLFELDKKDISGNSVMSAIYYRYISHMPFSSVKAFYQDKEAFKDYSLISESYMDPFINEIFFRKDDVRIGIEHRPPSGYVTIGCSKRN